MRFRRDCFRSARGWWLLTSSAMSGLIAGGIGVLWIPGAAAASIGSTVAVAVFTATSSRGKKVLERQAARRETLPSTLIAIGPDRRPRKIRELDDPIALRVHPAEALVHDMAGTRVLDRTPPYIRRDLHDELSAKIRRGRFVLVVGESTAGKTRMVYEAARATCPDHTLLAPANREALADVAEAVADTPRCVLWLDDLERFMGAGGLTPNLLDRILSHRREDAVITATMRSPEFDRYSAREEGSVPDHELDAWRDARDILRLADVVELSRRWTAEELARARAYDNDPRIRAALPNVGKFGLAEVLAAGPELVRNWHTGWAPGAHPRGAALVAAAVDCRRAGVDEPVPLDLLIELSRSRLNDRGGELLRPEPLDEALVWATRTSHGASSLLLPAEQPDHYIAFDYLVDLPDFDLAPLATWRILLARADPHQAFRIGEAAARTFQHSIAAEAFHKAAESGIHEADIAAEFYAAYGDQMKTNNRLEKIVDDRLDRLGRLHPETLSARLKLTESITDSPHSAEALKIFPELINDLLRTVGERHPDTINASRLHAYAIGVCGDPQTAIELLRKTLPLHQEVFGEEHMSTLLTRHYLAFFVAEDDPSGALEMLDDIQDRYTRAYGENSPRVLQIRDLRGGVLRRTGAAAESTLSYLRSLREDRIRIIGSDHAHTMVNTFNIVSVLLSMNRKQEAKSALDELLSEWMGDSPSPEKIQRVAVRLTGLRSEGSSRSLPSRRYEALKSLQILSVLRGCDDALTKQVGLLNSRSGILPGRPK
ncbi:hypothetical protein [Amycolatopsis nivea]|uniref:hypothetical protein n=1 Tax=Amycolatopsis nivea TaxID=1644109 RepID=UPI0014321B65|nr:hypothetical protein [Amycolatopsis nivea]